MLVIPSRVGEDCSPVSDNQIDPQQLSWLTFTTCDIVPAGLREFLIDVGDASVAELHERRHRWQTASAPAAERHRAPATRLESMMARYFFHIHDGKDIPDDLGHELPDLQAARELAIRISGDCLRDHSRDLWAGEEWMMEVTDERGLILFNLLFVATSAPSTRTQS